MNALVVVSKKQSEDLQCEFIHSLSEKAEVLVLEDFRGVKDAVSKQKYRVVILMTYGDSFPESWKMTELQVDCPTVILTNAKNINLFSIQSFIESFEENDTPDIDNPLFRKSLKYIEENLHENDLSLTKVASFIYVSRCHYSRMFNKYLGTGFKEYIMTKRIQRAKLLLKKGQPVTEVCYSVGYNDLTHFSRVFRKLVGVNPSTYRLSNRKVSYSGGKQ
ncbi:AraC family transcriptional regulator [Brevibacillus humidisoli]|uniref:helix-turn-helix transcriptional regulator n=1 Tax=Brevibacillus humidisoli TaxID=2895522 RepID=UPI001E5F757F|nr:AraC family transcriptional regulator [Brevibacillus humidisoli]UFJ42425.1 AraC family transcriptional regulator [Brevibacillus humidisoli]